VHHRHIIRHLFPGLGEPTSEMVIDHVVDFTLAALRDLRRGGKPWA
jgi:hypothetical protein